MGRIGITYSDVARAADELKEKEQNPTVDAVRAVLGTGSKSTIVPHLRRWRIKQENGEDRGKILSDLNFLNSIQDFYRHVQPELEDNLNYLKEELQTLSKENMDLLKSLRTLEKERLFFFKQRSELKKEVEKLVLI